MSDRERSSEERALLARLNQESLAAFEAFERCAYADPRRPALHRAYLDADARYRDACR
jgi:hypothetical protein